MINTDWAVPSAKCFLDSNEKYQRAMQYYASWAPQYVEAEADLRASAEVLIDALKEMLEGKDDDT